MNKTWILLKAQLINFSRINDLKLKNKKNILITGSGIALLFFFLSAYNFLTAQTLVKVGQAELIPSYMLSISSFIILILTVFYVNGILLESKDMEALLALPVKFSQIISSKFGLIYLINFLICLLFMLPAGIVWLINTGSPLLKILPYFLSIFFVPLIPTCFASFIGLAIVLISSRFKNKTIFSLIFSLISLGLIMYLAISSKQGGDMTNLGTMLAKQANRLYPPSYLFSESSKIPLLLGILIFILLSTLIFLLFVKIFSMKYGQLIALNQKTTKTSQKARNFSKKSPFSSLYHKEIGRYFNSYLLILNTSIGVVLLSFASLTLLVIPIEEFGNLVGIKNISPFLAKYAPLIVASMLSLSCTTASAISLEGKNIWILQSLPISTKTVVNSKLALNFSLHTFGYLLAFLAFFVKLDMSAEQLITLFVTPICYSIFISVLGIFLNIKFPNYQWENEMFVVKQSLPVLLTSAITMLAVAIPMLFHLFLSIPLLPLLWGTSLTLLIIAFILYQNAYKIKHL